MKKKLKKPSKKAYLHVFTFIVLALGILRLTTDIADPKPTDDTQITDSISPDSDALAEEAEEGEAASSEADAAEDAAAPEAATVSEGSPSDDSEADLEPAPAIATASEASSLGQGKPRIPHRILSVPRYEDAFPDSQTVQLAAALKYGVKPVQNRDAAEKNKKQLVYAGSCPWFYVDRLKTSIPYLVPRAYVLIQDIGRAFYDSLDVKGVPLHKIITTSVLRTKDDVARLRKRNGNATENSCHMYGTTFDICYNRYKTVEDPHGKKRRQVTNDTLKWVLSEVLRDMRQQGRCYVKYEKKQGCFHITTR